MEGKTVRSRLRGNSLVQCPPAFLFRLRDRYRENPTLRMMFEATVNVVTSTRFLLRGGWETRARCELISLLSGSQLVCIASVGTSSVEGSQFAAVLIKLQILSQVSQFIGEVDHYFLLEKERLRSH